MVKELVKKLKKKRGEKEKRKPEEQKEQKVFSILKDSFVGYWKNLGIIWPMLIFGVIAMIIFMLFAIYVGISIIGLIPKNDTLINPQYNLSQYSLSTLSRLSFAALSQQPQPSQQLSQQPLQQPLQQLSQFFQPSSEQNFESLESLSPSLKSLLINLLIAFIIAMIVIFIVYSIFVSSMLVFAREIAKKIKVRESFRRSFKECRYWLKWIGVKCLQGTLAIIYVFIAILISFVIIKNIAISITLGIIFAIGGYLLYIFILPMPYALVFYDLKVSKTLAFSIKNAKKHYLSLFLLNLLIDVIINIVSIILNFIPFVGFILSIFANFLVFVPIKAIAIMRFMNVRFEKA